MKHKLGGPTEGNCRVKSVIVVCDTRDRWESRDEKQLGVMPWIDLLNLVESQGGIRPTFDLFDVHQPDGTILRYRAVHEGFIP